MNTITVTFTEQERNALVQLIDLAVKAGGLNVAEPAIVLTRKLNPPQPEQAPTAPAPEPIPACDPAPAE